MSLKAMMGFRQYLFTYQSYDDLKNIIRQSKSLFEDTDQVLFMVAVCGDHPAEELGAVNIVDVRNHSYDIVKSARQVVDEMTGDERTIIVYYSEKKVGLTYPFALLIEIARMLGLDFMGLCDSDFQIPYSGIKDSFTDALAKILTRDEPCIYLPTRVRRSLDLQGYPINRFATEDLENAYYWRATGLRRIERLDLQSGVCYLNKASIDKLDLQGTGAWCGAIELPVQVRMMGGSVVKGMTLETNPQNESTISPEDQFRKIMELEEQYGIKLAQIINYAKERPKCFMDDWTRGHTKRDIAEILQVIEREYDQFKASS